MRRLPFRMTFLVLLTLPCLAGSCDALGDMFNQLGQNVVVVIENDTSYTAYPELRTSDSGSFFEDIFNSGELVSDFGDDGAIPPNQTVRVYLNCDGDLESIAFRGVEFREDDDNEVGDVDAFTQLRRDSDFDCGDTINIRLSGRLFDFDADVEVDRSDQGNDDRAGGDDDEERDIGDRLDELFGD